MFVLLLATAPPGAASDAGAGSSTPAAGHASLCRELFLAGVKAEVADGPCRAAARAGDPAGEFAAAALAILERPPQLESAFPALHGLRETASLAPYRRAFRARFAFEIARVRNDAEAGHGTAAAVLGALYATGLLTTDEEPTTDVAFQWYRRAAEAREPADPQVLAMLIDELRRGDCLAVTEDGVPEVRARLDAGLRHYRARRFEDAYDCWLPLAAAGLAAAQFHLGGMYHDGTGVRRDAERAAAWWRRAAAQGHKGAIGAYRRHHDGGVETFSGQADPRPTPDHWQPDRESADASGAPTGFTVWYDGIRVTP